MSSRLKGVLRQHTSLRKLYLLLVLPMLMTLVVPFFAGHASAAPQATLLVPTRDGVQFTFNQLSNNNPPYPSVSVTGKLLQEDVTQGDLGSGDTHLDLSDWQLDLDPALTKTEAAGTNRIIAFSYEDDTGYNYTRGGVFTPGGYEFKVVALVDVCNPTGGRSGVNATAWFSQTLDYLSKNSVVGITDNAELLQTINDARTSNNGTKSTNGKCGTAIPTNGGPLDTRKINITLDLPEDYWTEIVEKGTQAQYPQWFSVDLIQLGGKVVGRQIINIPSAVKNKDGKVELLFDSPDITPGQYDLNYYGTHYIPDDRIEKTQAAYSDTITFRRKVGGFPNFFEWLKAIFPTGKDLTKPPADLAVIGSPPIVTAPEGEQTPSDITCENAIDGGFGWLICPILDATDHLIKWSEEAIRSQLEVDTEQYNTAGLKQAWSAVARISSAILVLIALVMVIGTALGFGVFDAYTVKKVLPRLVIAAIGIWLSWLLVTTYITIMNDVGNGIADLMMSPFLAANSDPTLTDFNSLDLKYIVTQATAHTDGPTDFVFSGGIVGGILAAGIGSGGIFAILAALIPIASFILIGIFILTIRQAVIVFLLVMAPLGIAAWILPNTDKTWKLWSGTLNKLLIMFPIFMGIFAAGKIFAYTVAVSDVKGFLQIVIAVLAYVSPFVFLPVLFKAAGGIFSNLTGMVNNKGKGVFDKAKGGLNARAEASKKYKKTVQGEKRAQATISGYKVPFTKRRLGATAGLAKGRVRVDSGQPIFGGFTQTTRNRTETAFESLQTQIIETQTKEADQRMQRTNYYSDPNVLVHIAADKSKTLGERSAATARLITMRMTAHLDDLKIKMQASDDKVGNTVWQEQTTKNFSTIKEFAPQVVSGPTNPADPDPTKRSPFADPKKLPSAEAASKWSRDTWVDALNDTHRSAQLDTIIDTMLKDPQITRTMNQSLVAELQTYDATKVPIPITTKSEVTPKPIPPPNP